MMRIANIQRLLFVSAAVLCLHKQRALASSSRKVEHKRFYSMEEGLRAARSDEQRRMPWSLWPPESELASSIVRSSFTSSSVYFPDDESEEQERILKALERADSPPTNPSSMEERKPNHRRRSTRQVRGSSRTQDSYSGDSMSVESSDSSNEMTPFESKTRVSHAKSYKRRPTAFPRHPPIRKSVFDENTDTEDDFGRPYNRPTGKRGVKKGRRKTSSFTSKEEVQKSKSDPPIGTDHRSDRQVEQSSSSAAAALASKSQHKSSQEKNPSFMTQQMARPDAHQLGITPWTRKFLASRPRDFLLPIPKDYLSDSFNLARLAPIVERVGMTLLSEGEPGKTMYSNTSNATPPLQTTPDNKGGSSSYPIYREALQLILQEELAENVSPAVQRAAETLYCLVHARFAVTPRGLDVVRRRLTANKRSITPGKYTSVDPIFGRCPRLKCQGMPLLPFGEAEEVDLNGSNTSRRAKRYCCKCGECFYSWESKVDGCAWGPSFCHLFLLTFQTELFPEDVREMKVSLARGKHLSQKLMALKLKSQQQEADNCLLRPQVFGFQLHPSVTLCKNHL